MARKRYKPEEIVSLRRQAEVLHGQGMSMADAIRQLGISEVSLPAFRRQGLPSPLRVVPQCCRASKIGGPSARPPRQPEIGRRCRR